MHRRAPLFAELNLEMWTRVRSCQPSSECTEINNISHFLALRLVGEKETVERESLQRALQELKIANKQQQYNNTNCQTMQGAAVLHFFSRHDRP